MTRCLVVLLTPLKPFPSDLFYSAYVATMSNDSRITTDRQEQILANAKASARKAIETGETETLTALGWAYYDLIVFEESE